MASSLEEAEAAARKLNMSDGSTYSRADVLNISPVEAA
jgi:hypothetical protein